ncbi:MAG: hypothetical protein GY913_02205 [Proteobacteria bacterium]|nr:hypothetical protein [Pseudomonadota bacterium]MCP4915712.1 hypothetical protein [Pseudomonadota bacterium]
MIWLLLACTGEPNTDSAPEGDADTDADTDTDTDTDVVVEDCTSEGDEDGDGLADCEDPDCVDVCAEDCDNELDDDDDGDVDCDDDECAGEPACLGAWRMDVHVDVGSFEVDTSASTLDAQGSIVVFGTPYGEGEAFTCTGALAASEGFGTSLGSAACDGCDLQFDVAWYPFWTGGCPITPPLPSTQLGFTLDDAMVTRSFDDGWKDQYDAASSGTVGSVWTLEDLEQQNVWSFLGYY